MSSDQETHRHLLDEIGNFEDIVQYLLPTAGELPTLSGIDVYGKTMRIEFVDRLRDERRFESVDALVVQISKDVERAKEIFALE